MQAAADFLLANAAPDDPCCAFWTSYALYQMGGPRWDAWSKKLTKPIVATQIKDGDFKGAWESAGGCSRLTTTALRVLTLQAYYRYGRLVR